MMRARSVGFTATQEGMSGAQKITLRETLLKLTPDELHHGDCVGGDEECDKIARSLGVAVVIHPPTNSSKRAFCAQPGDVVWEPAPYLERNGDIVESSTVLIAAPRRDVEELRSGTWSTVRKARRSGRRVFVLARDGGVLKDPAPERRPSADLCSESSCDSNQAVGWLYDEGDGHWHSACEAHAEVIPAWQTGDWRYKKELVR